MGFERCYVDLLAGLWLELERFATDPGVAGVAVDRERIELGGEIVLLELALLDAGSDRWRAMRLVTAAERQRLRDLVAALRSLVAQIVDAPAESRSEAVARAQDRLFNELRARAAPLARHAPRAG
jgi:hypothetical protein